MAQYGGTQMPNYAQTQAGTYYPNYASMGGAGSAPGSQNSLQAAGNGREANSWHSVFRSGQFAEKTPMPGLAELVLFPWVVFLVIIVSMSLAHGSTSFMLWLPFVVVFGLALAFTYVEWRAGRSGEFILGALCLLAAVVGLAAGVYDHYAWTEEYYRLGSGAHYNNVAPTDAAGGYNDATSIVFTDNSRIDGSRTYGYLESKHGKKEVFCIAPVSTNPDTQMQVQFWAAGRDCCYQRTYFSCGAIDSPHAHGGIALERPYDQGFLDAVKGAEYAYGIQAGQDFVLLNWMQDPKGHHKKLHDRSRNFLLIFSGVFLLFLLGLGYFITTSMK